VAKTLSALSQAGLVTGSRGPGGGSALARDPKRIKLYDVYKLFEREDRNNNCPFGGGICGAGKPCPIHNKLVSVQQAMDRLLHKTTFADFRTGHAPRRRKTGSTAGRKTKGKRASFRATRTTPHRRRSPG
jgi:Rrf2 family protein